MYSYFYRVSEKFISHYNFLSEIILKNVNFESLKKIVIIKGNKNILKRIE